MRKRAVTLEIEDITLFTKGYDSYKGPVTQIDFHVEFVHGEWTATSSHLTIPAEDAIMETSDLH